MPTENGRIYRLPNETPAKGISLDDIGSCLGMSARDLGTLCQGMSGYETDRNTGNVLYKDANVYAGKIAQWSKFKPVFFVGTQVNLPYDNGTDPQLTQQWETRMQGSSDGYRNNPFSVQATGTSTLSAFKTAYGIEIPSGEELYQYNTSSGDLISTFTDVTATEGFLSALLRDGETVNLTSVVTLRWRYEPPLADTQYTAYIPFRVADFDRFNMTAACPLPVVPSSILPVWQVTSGNTTKCRICINAVLPEALPTDSNISFSELCSVVSARRRQVDTSSGAKTDPRDMYFCVLLYHTDDEGVIDHTTSNPANDVIYWACAECTYNEEVNGTNTPLTHWNRVYIDIEGGISGTQAVKLLSGDGRVKVKTFFCEKSFSQNQKPFGTGTSANKLRHFCLRGSESSTEVTFSKREDMNPYARVIRWEKTRNKDGETEYQIHAVLFNHSEDSVTFSHVALLKFDTNETMTYVTLEGLTSGSYYTNVTLTPYSAESFWVRYQSESLFNLVFYADYQGGHCGADLEYTPTSELHYFGEMESDSDSYHNIVI